MITAKQAKALKSGQMDDSQLLEIEKTIKKYATNGRNECFFYQEMTAYTRQRLRENGFTVGPTEWDQRENGYLTKISW